MPDDELTRWLMLDYHGDVDPLDTVPGWYHRAACRGRWTPADDPWFTPPHDSALAVCQTCPVREPCAEAGASEPYGIWGGMTERQRAEARQEAA